MIRRRVVALAFALLTSLPALAEFNDVARGIETKSGMNRVHVPGMWLARILTRAIDPEGVHDIRVVMFDSSSARTSFDAAAIMRSSLGPEWQAVVRFSDHRSGEQGVIYAKPSGSREISMMMFVIDGEESILTELRIDADRLARYVNGGAEGEISAR
ncbi:MAG: hypothetical protein ACSLFQ_18075 [Thermoanaerobaculia bacterium]